MSKIKLKQIIQLSSITNDLEPSHATNDFVFLQSCPNALHGLQKNKLFYHHNDVTDYALMCGCMASNSYPGEPANYYLRSSNYGREGINVVNDSGKITTITKSCSFLQTLSIGVRPVIRIKLKDLINIGAIKEYSQDGYIVELGEFPKTYVGKAKNDELEKLYQSSNQTRVGKRDSEFLKKIYNSSQLTPSGKKYFGHMIDTNYKNIVSNDEFVYSNEKFVRTYVRNYYSIKNNRYSNGENLARSFEYRWCKVEPIDWFVVNAEDITEDAIKNSSNKIIELQTTDTILSGLPFYPALEEKNSYLWQNSTIRGYLNGINVNEIATRTDTAKRGGNFLGESNFISEALDVDVEYENELLENLKNGVKKDIKMEKNNTERANKYNIQVLDSPMNVKDQIKFYINSGKNFMLHGPSGIGKSRRIEEADPDFVSIVLRNGILPEEIIGKTIYPNNNTNNGVWVPPVWYVALCEKCKNEPNKNHVLFIDEITNVRPTEQSLVFHLILNRSIGPNIGKLPKNVVVVAAGNNKEESESAYNMPEPLFRRFTGHIYLKPNIENWLEWANEPSGKGDRLKIHPLVSLFVGNYSKQVFYSAYDSEEPPEFAVDPRAWEQVSDIIYDNNGLIAKELIANKVGDDIARNFIEFAKNPPLTLDEVLNGELDMTSIPQSFSGRYALALSLKSVDNENVDAILLFIKHYLGAEILSMFIASWVGNDAERAILVQQIKQNNETLTY